MKNNIQKEELYKTFIDHGYRPVERLYLPAAKKDIIPTNAVSVALGLYPGWREKNRDWKEEYDNSPRQKEKEFYRYGHDPQSPFCVEEILARDNANRLELVVFYKNKPHSIISTNQQYTIFWRPLPDGAKI